MFILCEIRQGREKMETKILEQINEELRKSPIDWIKVHELEKEFFGQDLNLLVKENE